MNEARVKQKKMTKQMEKEERKRKVKQEKKAKMQLKNETKRGKRRLEPLTFFVAENALK